MSIIKERKIILDASLALEQCSPILKDAMVYTLNQNVEQIGKLLTQQFQDYMNEIASYEPKIKQDAKKHLKSYLQFVSPANFITNIDSIFDDYKLQEIEKIYRQSFYRLTANYTHENSERFLVDSKHFQQLVNEINDLKAPIAEKIAPYINAYQSYVKEFSQSQDTAIASLIGGFAATAVAGPLAGIVTRHFIRSNNSKDKKLEQFLKTQDELISVIFAQIMKLLRKIIFLLGQIYAGLATKLQEESQALKLSYQKFDKEQQLLMLDISNALERNIKNATEDVFRQIQKCTSQNEYEKAEELSRKLVGYFSRNKQIAKKLTQGISYGMASQLIHFTILAQQISAITDDKQKHFYYTKLFTSLTHAPKHKPVVYGINIVKLEDAVEKYMHLSVKLKEPKYVATAIQVLQNFLVRFQQNNLVYREDTEYLPATVTKYCDKDASIQYKPIKIQYPEQIMGLYESYEYAVLYEKISSGEIDDNPSSINEKYMEQIAYYDFHITEINLSNGTEDDYYRSAMYHLEGKHTKQNTELALERLKIAATSGHGQAIFQLISLIEENKFNATEKEYVELHLRLYDSDFAYNEHLLYRIGKFYQEGFGVEQNYVTALSWLERAAAMNHVSSMFEIGLLNETGVIGKKDKKEAFIWYKKAAELDEPRAKDKIERKTRKTGILVFSTLVPLIIVFLIWNQLNSSNGGTHTTYFSNDTKKYSNNIEKYSADIDTVDFNKDVSNEEEEALEETIMINYLEPNKIGDNASGIVTILEDTIVTLSTGEELVLAKGTTWEVFDRSFQKITIQDGIVLEETNNIAYEQLVAPYNQDHSIYGMSELQVNSGNVKVVENKTTETIYYLEPGKSYTLKSLTIDGWLQVGLNEWVRFNPNVMTIKSDHLNIYKSENNIGEAKLLTDLVPIYYDDNGETIIGYFVNEDSVSVNAHLSSGYLRVGGNYIRLDENVAFDRTYNQQFYSSRVYGEVEILAENINVYRSASSTSNIVGVLKKGQKLDVHYITNGGAYCFTSQPNHCITNNEEKVKFTKIHKYLKSEDENAIGIYTSPKTHYVKSFPSDPGHQSGMTEWRHDNEAVPYEVYEIRELTNSLWYRVGPAHWLIHSDEGTFKSL
ncbi:tetratricopeptide repeat protein [Bacillus sp. JJ1503]|uniref:tetratricopeptide repeat protein n=1 Tax=Bacillus sp. JJ1503 TaxID=3122956 RepID=UPI002FFF037F